MSGSLVENSLTRVIDTDLGDGDAFRNSRKPLVASFEFNGETRLFRDEVPAP